MHTLVHMHYLTRKEFERNLGGLTDEDARKRVEAMYCISWIIAHVAWQHHSFFMNWPQGKAIDDRYKPYGVGCPASQPPLEEAMALWRETCEGVNAWLQAATEESLRNIMPPPSYMKESGGTMLVRDIFHTWSHMGEISSIRQMLGHRPP